MLVVGLLGCSDDGPRQRPPDPEPLEVQGALTAVPTAPLSRELAVSSDVPTTLRLVVTGPGVDVDVTFPAVGTSHVVPVLGAKPGREIAVRAELTAEDGRQGVWEDGFETPPLPEDFPVIEITGDLDRAAPGYWLLPMDSPLGEIWFVALDPHDGEIAWFYADQWNYGAVNFTSRGTLFGLASTAVREMDRLGRPVRTFARAAPRNGEPFVPTPELDTPSHEALELPDGGFLTLTKEPLEVAEFPASYEEPTTFAPRTITDEAVIRFAADGSVVSRWWLSERLDTRRIGFDSLDALQTGLDWAHPNAILADPGGWLVEVRHQDGIVALDEAGDVRWIFSHPLGWSPGFEDLVLEGLPGISWPLHPHGPDLLPDGTLVLFDNGNEGHTPYEPPPTDLPRSRVAAYTIDEAARTVATAWTWEPPGRLYSPALGSVRGLPNGHVLADFGFVSEEGDTRLPRDGVGLRSIRLFELEPGVAEPVVDVSIWRPYPPHADGVKCYRAIPIPTFYPEAVAPE